MLERLTRLFRTGALAAPRVAPASASRARNALLARFLSAQDPSEFTGGARGAEWEKLLGESMDSALRRMLAGGELEEAPLIEHVLRAFRATELKSFARERGLRVGGSKEELAQRLVAADPAGMTALVPKRQLLTCSPRSRAIAEQYTSERAADREHVEGVVLELLAAGDYRGASTAVADYEARQLFPRGVGIDWHRYDPSEDVAVLRSIFAAQPAILAGISAAVLPSLRTAAAVMHLWGINRIPPSLRAGDETGIRLGDEEAARMLLFFALSQRDLASYFGRRAGGAVRAVEISPAPDCCPSCRRLSGRQFTRTTAPELPHPGCTSAMGCRCTFVPVVRAARSESRQ